MKLFKLAIPAMAAALLLSSTLVATPVSAQRSPGGCTQDATGGPAGGGGSGNRGARQDSEANLLAVIGVAVQNVAADINAEDILNLSGTNLSVVCLNDVLNQNDIRFLNNLLRESDILSENSNNLNNLLQNADILNNLAVANNVQVVAINLGTGQIFLLEQVQ